MFWQGSYFDVPDGVGGFRDADPKSDASALGLLGTDVSTFYLDAMFYRILHWAGKFAIILVWVNILCHCFRVDLENSLPFVLYHFASVISSFHLVIMEL